MQYLITFLNKKEKVRKILISQLYRQIGPNGFWPGVGQKRHQWVNDKTIRVYEWNIQSLTL